MALACLAALPLSAQDTAAQSLLERVRSHMTEALNRQPNYTCLETVVRESRSQRESDYRVRDVFGLEVALVNHKEMFAFPGAKEFDDSSLRAFVPRGMFGDGYFGMYATAAFEDPRTEFESGGETELNGVRAVQYTFHVPPESGIEIHSMDAVAIVGYHGSLYADPNTLDVLKLEVAAEKMPVKLELRETTGDVEYARVRIGSGELLLPVASRLEMINWRGDVTRNRMTFSECREFTGQSTITFGSTKPNVAAAALATQPAKREIQIPAGLAVVMRLLSETETHNLELGNPVRAVLDADLKADGKVLFPKGSIVSGRLVRLVPVGNTLMLGLTCEEVESETAHAELNLTFQRATGEDLVASGSRFGPAGPPGPHEGLIHLRPGRAWLTRSVRLHWKT